MEAGNCPCIKLVKVLLKKLQNDLFKVIIRALDNCLLTSYNIIRPMRKVFHPQVASVLQSAFREFRHVSSMAVEKIVVHHYSKTVSGHYIIPKSSAIHALA